MIENPEAAVRAAIAGIVVSQRETLEVIRRVLDDKERKHLAKETFDLVTDYRTHLMEADQPWPEDLSHVQSMDEIAAELRELM